MRRLLFAAGLILILVSLNVAVWHKQALLARGTRVYLRLAPVDPRSLMQGDYMRLRYELERKIPDAQRSDMPPQGTLVLAVGADGVSRFERLHRGEAPGPGECLLRYHRGGQGLALGAESFFFQEGQASLYTDAKYGVLVVSPQGEALLVGLADDKLRLLGPTPSSP